MTTLQIQTFKFKYKNCSIRNVSGAKPVHCDVSNWLCLEKKRSTAALAVTDYDLSRCTAEFRLLERNYWIVRTFSNNA